jgi:hypothetical protein
MSEQESAVSTIKVDLAGWREKKQADPSIYLKRQASEVILFAIALCPQLQPYLLLKGGTLMGVAHGSPRQTVDIDFTMTTSADETDKDEIKTWLNQSMKMARAILGHDLLELGVQNFKWDPKGNPQKARNFRALGLKIGYAIRGTNQHKLLLDGRAATVVEIDISFNEPESRIQILELDQGLKLLAYSWIEQIAEKFRALLQQSASFRPNRKQKIRRQDIYDIDRLVTNIDLGVDQWSELVLATRQKCHARNIYPISTSFDNPKLRELSGQEWDKLTLEIDEVPRFDDCYDRVAAFYRALPWPEEESHISSI